MAETVNQTLVNRETRHSVYLEGLKTQTVHKLIRLLNSADDNLTETLRQRGAKIAERGFDTGPVTTKRLTELLTALNKINADVYAQFDAALRQDLQAFVKYEAGWQTSLLDNTLTIQLGVTQPDLRTLFKIVTARPMQGRLLREWAKGLETQRAARLRDAIRIGMVEGEPIDKIVRRVRGTRAAQYSDGILEIGRRDAAAVVRTAVAHTAAVARDATYQDNFDIIKSVQWISVLDGRTTALCRARDLKVYPLKSGPRPPAHINCRSTTCPITKSFRELGLDMDELSPATRASMNGQVPAGMNYGEWLKTQDRAFVEHVLGVKKAKLFLDGKLPIDKFVNRAGHELTLEQLAERDPVAFKRAGL